MQYLTVHILKVFFGQVFNSKLVSFDILNGKCMPSIQPLLELKLDPGGLYYKTFYSRNLRIFIISQSVCPWQAFTAF